MISRNSFGDAYQVKCLGEVVEFLDSKRRPVTEADRRSGPYPYFGANGQQGTIDDYIFDEPLVLLAEDGGHFATPERGIAYRISGKTWVNNHAHVLRPKDEMNLDFLFRVLENYDVTPFFNGTTRGKLTKLLFQCPLWQSNSGLQIFWTVRRLSEPNAELPSPSLMSLFSPYLLICSVTQVSTQKDGHLSN